jgi:hypothetical protein
LTVFSGDTFPLCVDTIVWVCNIVYRNSKTQTTTIET